MKNILADNKEWLYDQYITQEKTTREIAKEFDVGSSTIKRWLHKHNIPIRPAIRIPEKLHLLNDIIQLYTIENKSSIEISEILHVSDRMILKYLHRTDVKIRSPGEIIHVDRANESRSNTMKNLRALYPERWPKYVVSEATREKFRIISSERKSYAGMRNTSIELKLQKELSDRNIIFETDKPLERCTRADIFIEPNIAIYADGDYWHNIPERKIKDSNINKRLLDAGYKVYRFWEHDIHNDPISCIDKVEFT